MTANLAPIIENSKTHYPMKNIHISMTFWEKAKPYIKLFNFAYCEYFFLSQIQTTMNFFFLSDTNYDSRIICIGSWIQITPASGLDSALEDGEGPLLLQVGLRD